MTLGHDASGLPDGGGPEFGAACGYTNCEQPTFPGTPLCYQHLTQIKLKQKKQRDVSVPKGNTSGTNNVVSRTKENAPIPSKIRGGGFSTTYLRRKTASNGVVRLPSSKTSTTSTTTQSISVDGAPPTPSSRSKAEASYFASSTLSGDHNGSSNPADKSDRSTVTNAFLTPTESPPELRAEISRKRSRSDFQDDERQSNGTDRAQLGKVSLAMPTTWGWAGQGGGRTPPHGSGHQKIQRGDLRQSGAGETSRAEQSSDVTVLPTTPQRRLSLFRRMRDRDRDRDRDRKALATATNISLDTYVYNQGPDVAPLPPPPNVVVPSKAELAAVASAAASLPTSYRASSSSSSPSYIYAHIDPRVHWTRARSKEWHAAKQTEIKARGGRKANLGKAAQRNAKERRREEMVAATGSGAGSVNGTTNGIINGATSPPPAPVLSSLRRPAIWTGDLPADVQGNQGWMTYMGMFVDDEDDRRKMGRRTAPQGRQKSRN